MADDDLQKLAAEDVVYLSKTLTPAIGSPAEVSTEVFRRRLRQALSGEWVFNASTGQNGAIGVILGQVETWSASSSESPVTGIVVTLQKLIGGGSGTVERIDLTTLIPSEFAD